MRNWIIISMLLIMQCRIQQFFWGVGFSTSLARRKAVAQLGSLVGKGRRPRKSSSVWSKGAALENCGYFAFWIAQNIALVNLRQKTVTKACTRNQHVWRSEFGIPNRYTGFKIALDTALQWRFFTSYSLESISFSSNSMKNIGALPRVLILTTGIYLPLVLRNNYFLNAPNFRRL